MTGVGRLLIGLTSLTLLTSGRAAGAPLTSLVVRFERSVNRTSALEAARGTIYFQAPNRILLHVDSSAFARRQLGDSGAPRLSSRLAPMNQWLSFCDSSLLVYYPDEGKAFDIRSRTPFMLPFFQAFVGIVQEDFGLVGLGFTLARSENVGETLFTHWRSPKELARQLSEIRLGLVDNRLALAETRDAKRKPLVRTTYGDYVEHNGAWFPLSVASFEYGSKGTVHEEVKYREPDFGAEVPDSIADFQLPAETKVQSVQW